MTDEEKSELCQKCGDCCKFIVFDLPKPIPFPDEALWKEYVEARGAIVIPYDEKSETIRIRINHPCPQLVTFLVGTEFRYRCSRYENRPANCMVTDGLELEDAGVRCLWRILAES